MHTNKIKMVLFAYSIGLLLGEGLLDRMYEGKKWRRYSGLFILLRQRIQLSEKAIYEVIEEVYSLFTRIVFGYVELMSELQLSRILTKPAPCVST